MSKDKISDYSSTANSNTDIAAINIDEGCAPSGINNAIRALMAQLKNWQSGAQDVYITPAGSVSAPAVTTNGDTNTGVYFPAADKIALATGGTQAVIVDSSQNVGIGTSSPISKLSINGYLNSQDSSNNGAIYLGQYLNANGAYGGFEWNNTSGLLTVRTQGAYPVTFATSNTERMRIDSSGNVGIGVTPATGTTSNIQAAGDITLYGGSRGFLGNLYYQSAWKYAGTGYGWGWIDAGSGNITFQSTAASGTAGAAATLAERMRIDSSGNLLVGTTSSTDSDSVGIRLRPGASSSTVACTFNSNASGSTYHLYNLHASFSGYRFYVNYNGGIANYSANNTNLSDERVKTNIELSGCYLEKICAIPVKLFNYKDEPEGEQRTLGVIAQDVEAVAPELVNNDGFGETPEDGVPLKTIYQTDLQYALMKCIQELKAELDAAKADIAALKGQA